MKTRTIAFAFALMCLLAAAFGTASAGPVVTLGIISPNQDGILTTPYVSFSWSYAINSTYKLKIWSVDGQQSITVNFAMTTCLGTCTYGFNPVEHNWVWRENTAYKWQLKGFNSAGVLSAKSGKLMFTTDMVRPVTLLSPVAGQLTSRMYPVDFSWEREYGVAEYRLLITRPNGQRIKTTWMPYNTVCVQLTCGYNFSFMEFEAGTYSWKVLGRDAGVNAMSKSVKYALHVQ